MPFRTRLGASALLGLVLWFFPEVWRLAAPALSPFVAICSRVARHSLAADLVLAMPMLVTAILYRRFWCRHLCPVGLLSESCGKLRGPLAPASGTAARAGSSWPPARFFALTTLGGAVAGYPLLLWMDPLALFGGFFSVARIARADLSALSAVGLPLVMLISIVFPGKWCARLCPLGGAQDLLALTARPRDSGRPRLRLGSISHPRRALLAAGAGTIFAAVAARPWASRRREIRPPGAVDEAAFKGGCIRCGSCVRACPTGIIQPAVEQRDVTGFLAPRLRFSGPDYCLQDCNLCGRVCPTGVIRLLPLAEKNRHVIGIVSINLSECYLTLERECGICVARCPRAAIVDTFVRETYQTTVKVVREKCNGCGACVGICPPGVIRIEAAERA